MGRNRVDISEQNKRRVDLLTAFAILHGDTTDQTEIINKCIEDYFAHVADSYSQCADHSDKLLDAMKKLL